MRAKAQLERTSRNIDALKSVTSLDCQEFLVFDHLGEKALVEHLKLLLFLSQLLGTLLLLNHQLGRLAQDLVILYAQALHFFELDALLFLVLLVSGADGREHLVVDYIERCLGSLRLKIIENLVEVFFFNESHRRQLRGPVA